MFFFLLNMNIDVVSVSNYLYKWSKVIEIIVLDQKILTIGLT